MAYQRLKSKYISLEKKVSAICNAAILLSRQQFLELNHGINRIAAAQRDTTYIHGVSKRDLQ
jgi:hypothetical protein